MTSVSGKTTINWSEFAERLAPVEVISEPVLVKKRSRDCFWYSPVLNNELIIQDWTVPKTITGTFFNQDRL